MTIEPGLMVAVIGCVCTLSTFLGNKLSKSKMEGAESAAIQTELKHICEKLGKLEQKFDALTNQNNDVERKVAIIERDLKTAFHKIGKLEG